MPTDWTRRCPLCDAIVRHAHHCTATEVKHPPLEGQDALEAVRRVKAALLASKHPEQVPTDPQQHPLDLESGGL